MSSYNLSQLANSVPHVLSQVQKPRLIPALGFDHLPPSPPRTEEQASDVENASEFDHFFDWPLYDHEQYNEAESSNKSDHSSMPGLTSASTPTPSDEGGASPSPLRDVEDRFTLRDKLKEVKQSDDKYTFPQRELKPRGEPKYYPNIQIHNHGQSPPSSATDFSGTVGGGSWLTPPPSSRETSARPSPRANNPAPRGKRTGPLKNGDEVAGVRSTGSCFCCKLRKVKCGQEYPCPTCVEKARKYAGYPTAHQICFRRPLDKNALFQLISRADRSRFPEGSRSPDNVCNINVFFGSTTGPSQPLTISVVLEDYTSKMQQDECSYRLNLDRLPSTDRLCAWSVAHMVSTGYGDFQAALDLLILKLAQSAPHSTLISKVHQMRCLYKIWRQRELLFQRGSDTPTRLPRLLHAGIGNIVKSTMKGLESDILSTLNKTLSNNTGVKPQESLPLWASMMQMILIYRDLHAFTAFTESARTSRPGNDHYDSGRQLLEVSATLFSALVVACEVCFAKKGVELTEECNREEGQGRLNIKSLFSIVEERQDQFFRNLNSQSGSLDQLLLVLGGTTKKTSPKKSSQKKTSQKKTSPKETSPKNTSPKSTNPAKRVKMNK